MSAEELERLLVVQEHDLALDRLRHRGKLGVEFRKHVPHGNLIGSRRQRHVVPRFDAIGVPSGDNTTSQRRVV